MSLLRPLIMFIKDIDVVIKALVMTLFRTVMSLLRPLIMFIKDLDVVIKALDNIYLGP